MEPVAKIRSYESKDDKEIRFLIAKSAMEGLASANIKTIFNGVSIAIWLLSSYFMIQLMDWWPKPHEGAWTWLSLILPLGCSAVPIVVFSEWNNRPHFEALSQRILHGPDMFGLLDYYAKSPASGLWILEFSGRLIGFVAIDASPDSEIVQLQAAPKANKTKTKRKTAETAVIRHIYVDEQFRPTNIQKDLIEFALQKTFTADSTVVRVKATSTPLRDYAEKALIGLGFKFEGVSETLGLLRWKVNIRVLTREDWKNRQSSDSE
ncbi:hypothetical protein BT96DRAFT_846896 [Gymnopus androsaceus JB14]|uniref:N-acetyltransferase domain-containing protein n=1 Tax=Gymnopus androsaceus JB14 TaxID=1447944 RepID=A0A6A4IKN4_9AGAR|nr:hypothetical protein BT96DRAFT_846896 [Gymnopus androsaceus JB14]